MTLYRIGPDGTLVPAYTPRRDRRTGRHRDPSRAFRSTGRYRRWRDAVIARDGACVDCGHTGDRDNPLTADHVVPVAHGGAKYDLGNGACRCRRCNSRKGTR